jgi:hypothetical protein
VPGFGVGLVPGTGGAVAVGVGVGAGFVAGRMIGIVIAATCSVASVASVGSVGNSSVSVWQLTKNTMAAATMSPAIRLRTITGPPTFVVSKLILEQYAVNY